MIPNTILLIGSQKLIPIGDHYRFVIAETLPHTGFKFKFSVRERILDEMIKRGTRLAVGFEEYPTLEINENPLYWKNIGEFKREVKLFKDHPMPIRYYYVIFIGELAPKNAKQLAGQPTLFT